MDKYNFEIFISFIKHLEKKGKLIIIVTHDVRFSNFHAMHYQINDGHVTSKDEC